MGKGTVLWDDSALINAFDHAMAKYKAMHSEAYIGNSLEAVNHNIDGDENVPVLTEEATGHIEVKYNGNSASNSATEICVPCDNTIAATALEENHLDADVHAAEPHKHSSGFPCIDEKVSNLSDQKGVEYDQLLQQYYELEVQKQKVLQQLQQGSYWNYQTSVQCPTCPTQVPTYGASEHGQQTSCDLCSCHCLAAPLISYGCCAPWIACSSASQAYTYSGGQCPAQNASVLTSSAVAPWKQSVQADDYAVKTGMMAAERAISSVKTEISSTSKAFDEKEAEKEKEKSTDICEGKGSHSIASDPDLAVVLSAWYAAGFHTGRYLMEQSNRKANK